MIPRRIVRTVPVEVDPDVEALWEATAALHPGWDMVTYRDPIDPAVFPLTSPHWKRCRNGAQLAGLIRLEALLDGGGIYLDSDMQIFKPLDPLLGAGCFAGYETPDIVPDFVIGAEAGHPAIAEALALALARIQGRSGEPVSWMTDRGAWSTGPGVTSTVFRRRADVLLLSPDAFAGVFYDPRDTLNERLATYAASPPPWAFGVHRWAWSWR